MPDIKEKPKSAQIKSRDKKARSPREVSEGMKANAVRKLREKGREQLPDRQADVQDGVNHPNPGAHAAEQIEHGAYTGIRTTGDAAKAGLDRFRRKQAEKRKLHRAARQAEEQPAVAAKTAEEMRTVYAFTDYQNDALTELLADRASLSTLTGDLSITNVDAKALLDALPEDLSPERRAIIETACQLVGKVNYFWGGKSLVLGWDSRWGATMQVTADGSSTTGTYRPFGLDCSG